MLEQSVSNLLNLLASSEPAPGGGAVAALAGAMSCSMISMVCNLTIGKKKYVDVSEELQGILKRSEELRKNFQDLVAQDIEAFGDVMAARQMKKETKEQKMIRDEALQHALQKATFVPLRTMEYALEALKLAHRTAQIGNVNVISDAGVGAIMAQSALYSASLNIDVNLKKISDHEFVDRICLKSEDLLEEGEGIIEETLDIIDEIIYGEE